MKTAVAVDWRHVAEVQRAQIADLEETVASLRSVLRSTATFPADWRLTGSETRAARLLALRDWVSIEQMMEAVKLSERGYGSPDTVRVVLHRLRKKLKGLGIEVRNLRGRGYYFPGPSKDKVRAALSAASTIET